MNYLTIIFAVVLSLSVFTQPFVPKAHAVLPFVKNNADKKPVVNTYDFTKKKYNSSRYNADGKKIPDGAYNAEGKKVFDGGSFTSGSSGTASSSKSFYNADGKKIPDGAYKAGGSKVFDSGSFTNGSSGAAFSSESLSSYNLSDAVASGEVAPTSATDLMKLREVRRAAINEEAAKLEGASSSGEAYSPKPKPAPTYSPLPNPTPVITYSPPPPTTSTPKANASGGRSGGGSIKTQGHKMQLK